MVTFNEIMESNFKGSLSFEGACQIHIHSRDGIHFHPRDGNPELITCNDNGCGGDLFRIICFREENCVVQCCGCQNQYILPIRFFNLLNS